MIHVLQVRPQNVSMYVKIGPQKSISNVVMKSIRAKNHTLWDELVTSPISCVNDFDLSQCSKLQKVKNIHI